MRKPLWPVLSALVLLILTSTTSADPVYPGLRACADAQLQGDLEHSLKRLGLVRAVRGGDLAVALVDVTDPRRPRLAEVNGDEMLYAASLPKIAILLGAFEQAARGRLTLDAQTRDTLTRMIRNSSNEAATQMLHRVGKPFLAKLLESQRYRLYDARYNGGLWVGKDYGKAPAWKRDPLHHLSHGATAMQVARFYYLLETGRLVSPAMSRQMKAILGEPAIHHKFVKGLEQAGLEANIYRKSGTWRDWHADSAIVEHDGHRYIAVALAHSPNGGKWLSRLIVAMDAIIAGPTTRLAKLDASLQ